MRHKQRDTIRLGLLLPRAGPMGMMSLASENCAQLAIAELNAGNGLGGRFVEYVTLDAYGDPRRIARASRALVDSGEVDAWIGMHTSDVRVAVAAALESRVPYVFTPMYEGGERGAGVYLVGDTPEHQMQPMISWMSSELGSRKWYLLGNAYNYPYLSNQHAKHFIAESGGSVMGEAYVSFAEENMSTYIAAIARSSADTILVNLVGVSAVIFHRAFVAAGLDDKMLRFCCLLEENTLLAIEADATRSMYTSNGYFEGLQTSQAQAFEENYRYHFGQVAPVLNHFAVSCYEAVYLLDAIQKNSDRLVSNEGTLRHVHGVAGNGPRGELYLEDRHAKAPVYIGQADGLGISLLATV